MDHKRIVLYMVDMFNYDKQDHVLVHSRYDDDIRSYEVTLIHKGRKDVYSTLYNDTFEKAEQNTYKLVLNTLIERAFLNYDRL
jgi:hypothetical protein